MESLKETLYEFLELIPVVEELLARYKDPMKIEDTHRALSELRERIQRELNRLEGINE